MCAHDVSGQARVGVEAVEESSGQGGQGGEQGRSEVECWEVGGLKEGP